MKSFYITLKKTKVDKTLEFKDFTVDLDKLGDVVGIECLDFVKIEVNGRKIKI